MDPDRDHDTPVAPRDTRPADVDLLPPAEVDPEVAVAYAAWRLDFAEAPR